MIAELKIIALDEAGDISRALVDHLSDGSINSKPALMAASAGSANDQYQMRGIPGISDFIVLTGSLLSGVDIVQKTLDALRATVAQFSNTTIDFEIKPANGPAFVLKGEHLRSGTAQECLDLYKEVCRKWSGMAS